MNRKALLAKGVLVLIAEFAVFAALLFVSAGTVLWPAGWVFMAIFFVFALAITLWVDRHDRYRGDNHSGTRCSWLR
jgi:membrane protein implicated in regulation of membrane protease activity